MASENEQLWFFRFEQEAKPEFKQAHRSWEEVMPVGLSFRSALEILGLEYSDPPRYNFYLFSDSMKAAVQLLTDRSIYVTWKLYCADAPVVELIVRPENDQSPNSSRCPSSQASLAQRRKTSGRRNLSEISLRPPITAVSQNLDASQLTPVKALPDDRKVVLDLGRDGTEVFSKDYLLGWISAEFENGKTADDIVVITLTPKHRPINIKLDRDIWMKSLLRGAFKDEFLPLWNRSNDREIVKTDSLKHLYERYPYAENNAKVLIKDMKQFGSNSESRNRLLNTNHRFCLGGRYFSVEAVEAILQLPVGNDTLEASLNALMAKKHERGQSDEMCAAHDLVPIFQRAFAVGWSEIRKENDLSLLSTDPRPLKKRESKFGTLRKAFGKMRTAG